MYDIRLGDDPKWVLYQLRERLEFTDPPTATPSRHRPIVARRGVPAVIAALAITTTTFQADTAASDRADTTESPTHRTHRHWSLSYHTKEILP